MNPRGFSTLDFRLSIERNAARGAGRNSNRKSKIPQSKISKGFTLLEILAAVAVFSILLVCVTQMLFMGQQLSNHAFRRMDLEQEARFVLDRLAGDLNRAIFRPDVDFMVKNDELAFYAEIPTYGAGRKLGLVSYRMHPEGLQRGLSDPKGNGMAFLPRTLTSVGGGSTSDGILNDARYDPLSATVIRTEFLLIDQNGRALPTNATWNPRQVGGILAALVLVDKSSREQLTEAQVEDLAGQFPELPESTNSVMANITLPWVNRATSSAIQQMAIPGRAKQNLRIYQRFFPLKN